MIRCDMTFNETTLNKVPNDNKKKTSYRSSQGLQQMVNAQLSGFVNSNIALNQFHEQKKRTKNKIIPIYKVRNQFTHVKSRTYKIHYMQFQESYLDIKQPSSFTCRLIFAVYRNLRNDIFIWECNCVFQKRLKNFKVIDTSSQS